MKKMVFLSFAALLALTIRIIPAFGETIHCAECGMMADTGATFTARIVQSDKNLYFCDIGDLLVYWGKKKPQNVRAEVKNYPDGAWVDAQKAFFVHSSKIFNTPMGWGIAAFKDKNEAAGRGKVMLYNDAIKAVQ